MPEHRRIPSPSKEFLADLFIPTGFRFSIDKIKDPIFRTGYLGGLLWETIPIALLTTAALKGVFLPEIMPLYIMGKAICLVSKYQDRDF